MVSCFLGGLLQFFGPVLAILVIGNDMGCIINIDVENNTIVDSGLAWWRKVNWSTSIQLMFNCSKRSTPNLKIRRHRMISQTFSSPVLIYSI